jgi:uncharacterized membrane protein
MDVLRALAVLLMLQGHTIHALLAPEFRSMDSLLYSYWHSFRGYTAPIFMFTAGSVFSYLLFKSGKIELRNPRIIKGIKRALLLLGIGYFLRFPTFKYSEISNISAKQWHTFYSIDALHLIGLGLISIILLSIITNRISKYRTLFFTTFTLLIFFMSDSISALKWNQFLPIPLASYFTNQYGSLFPLFPWLGYVTGGAVMGNILAQKVYRSKVKMSLSFLATGILILMLSVLIQLINYQMLESSLSALSSFSFSLWRIGIVVLLISFISFIFRNFIRLPLIVNLYGKHSLIIYVVHLIIIYGSAVIAGLSYVYGQTLTLFECLAVFAFLNLATVLLCILVEFIANKKQFVANFVNVIFRKLLPGIK